MTGGERFLIRPAGPRPRTPRGRPGTGRRKETGLSLTQGMRLGPYDIGGAGARASAKCSTAGRTSSRSSPPAPYSSGARSPGVSEFTEEEIRAAVEEAAKYGTFVAAHAHGAEGIKSAVRAGVRSIEHGSLMDDEASRS